MTEGKPLRRKIWTSSVAVGAVIATLIAGCTGAELASLPMDTGGPRVEMQAPKVLKVGDNAIISLRNGETLRGEVVAVDSENVKVARTDNSGRVEDDIRSSEIVMLERVTAGNVGWVVLGASVGIMALLAHNLLEYEGN